MLLAAAVLFNSTIWARFRGSQIFLKKHGGGVFFFPFFARRFIFNWHHGLFFPKSFKKIVVNLRYSLSMMEGGFVLALGTTGKKRGMLFNLKGHK